MLAPLRRLLLSTSLLLLVLLTHAAYADTLVVEDGLVFYGPADVLDDVIVRDGGILFLDGALVAGRVRVERGGALLASATLFEGPVRADRALLIELSHCSIDGNVELNRTGGDGDVLGIIPQISVFQCQIEGDLQISRSDMQSLLVANNHIAGKLELSRNRTQLPARVENNVVLGRRHCR